jgi:hypothetical protein
MHVRDKSKLSSFICHCLGITFKWLAYRYIHTCHRKKIFGFWADAFANTFSKYLYDRFEQITAPQLFPMRVRSL